MKMDFDLRDLNRSALERMVKALLVAGEDEEKKMMDALSERAKKPAKNDLADLDEEMHGKPNTPKVEENDDAFDLEVKGDDGEDSETDAAPKKKGRK